MQNFNPYQQYYPNNAYPTQTSQPTQQIQNGGFVTVPSEEVIPTYPVALGNCVTFKIEGKPIVIEKIRGFSQFEAPVIKRYRLVEEEVEDVKEATPDNIALDSIKGEIKSIWSAIEEIKNAPKKSTPRRKDDNGGED
jgi:hypothetical protein